MSWTVDHVATEPSAGYTILACVESSAALYVLVEGPPPKHEPPIGLKRVEASTPSNTPLTFQSLTSSGDKRNDLIVAKFHRPPADTPHLQLTIEIEGVFTLAARIVRRPPNDDR